MFRGIVIKICDAARFYWHVSYRFSDSRNTFADTTQVKILISIFRVRGRLNVHPSRFSLIGASIRTSTTFNLTGKDGWKDLSPSLRGSAGVQNTLIKFR
jgi:hypothetical protein